MASRAHQQLREDMWEYRNKSVPGEDENVVKFVPLAPNDHGANALQLVQQAAEIFGDMEKRTREVETRARAMCESLTAKLQLAEQQRDVAEHARRDAVNELNGKLQEVTKALQQAQSRIVVAEDRAVAAEFRAQSIDVRLHKANRDLAAVEEAIRTRLF